MTQFNKEQYRAVRHKDGPMLVLAGPGSGKTAVIVGRVLHLITKEHVDPHGILVLTFSRLAAAQMQSRFLEAADEPYPVTFGTFHAIFYHILKRQGLYRSGEILTNNRKLEILRRVSQRTGTGLYDDVPALLRMLNGISSRKMGNEEFLDDLSDDERACLEKVFTPYIRQCREEGALDFDDMINECLKALKGNDKILKKWQERYKYILVDEFQDIDIRQYEILKLLAGEDKNVFCVGDDDQSIYSFRGARPEIIKNMPDDFEGTQIVRLKLNYRCPAKVIDHAYRLIIKNRSRFDKLQECINDEGEECVKYRCFKTADEEAAFCVRLIDRLLNEDEDNKASVAVLYRISKSADIIEERLKNARILYRRKDKGEGFYDKEWVKDILAYLRYAVFGGKNDLTRILNRPYRGLSRECLTGAGDTESILEFYRDDKEGKRLAEKLFNDIGFIRELNCYGALNYILKGIGMREFIKERYFKGHMEELEEALSEFTERARGYKSIKEWIGAIDDAEDDTVNTEEADERVQLMTIHGSKGLEFDDVIMIGLQEGVFPGKRCETKESLEEERRLFYVAMTRCRKRLWLLGRHKDDYGKQESRFLEEAGFKSEIL